MGSSRLGPAYLGARRELIPGPGMQRIVDVGRLPGMAEHVLDGRFALLDRLGSGGMSVVWRARDEVLGRTVAVKVLAGRYADDPDSRHRIRDEARAAAALSHPNVAQVYDYGESDDRRRTGRRTW